MSDAPSEPRFVRSVFHPSDFSPASERAFAHALAIALIRGTRFTLCNAGGSGGGDKDWTGFPGVRATLERWGLLAPGSPQSAVLDELKVRVEKVKIESSRPVPSILGFLSTHPNDLIVLSTSTREGLPGWMGGSVAEQVARGAETMTLFIPEESRPFVDLETGALSLKRVLVPVDLSPDPARTLLAAARSVAMSADGVLEVVLLHVGDPFPAIDAPDLPGVSWRRETRVGDPVAAICEAAESLDADLIAMTTRGHDGFLDAVRGSVTEQVLRRGKRPLLAVPASLPADA